VSDDRTLEATTEMNKLLAPLVAAAAFGLAVTPAAACRVGGDTILFLERPTPVGLDGAEVLHVLFTNKGRVVEYFASHYQRAEFAPSLIGVAYVDGGEAYVPVYVHVNSCMHELGGRPALVHDGEFFIVGRWILLPDGARALQAGSLWWPEYQGDNPSKGTWHY